MGKAKWVVLTLGGLFVVVVLALVLGIYVGPTAPVPTDPVVRWNAEHANLPDNAAPVYEEALAALVGNFNPAWDAFKDCDCDTDDVPVEVAEYVRDNALAIAIIRRAAEMENCWFDVSYDPDGWLRLAHLPQMRKIVHIMQMHVAVTAREHDWRKYADDVEVIARIGGHADQSPALLSHLLSSAFRAGAAQMVMVPLEWPQLTSKERASYIASVIDTLGPPRSMVDVLREEQESATWLLVTAMRSSVSIGALCPNGRIAGEIERFYTPYIELAALPVEDQVDPDQSQYKQIEQNESSGGYAGINIVRTLALMSPPSFLRAFQIRARCIAEQRGRFVVLRLFQYQHDHGAFPDALDALGDDVPGDPYSRGPFVYRRTPAGFTLYSVGVDRDDDGGVHDPRFGDRGDDPPDGDFVFWPIPDVDESRCTLHCSAVDAIGVATCGMRTGRCSAGRDTSAHDNGRA